MTWNFFSYEQRAMTEIHIAKAYNMNVILIIPDLKESSGMQISEGRYR